MSTGYRRTLKCYDCGAAHSTANPLSLRTVHDTHDRAKLTHVPFCDRCITQRQAEGRHRVEGDLEWAPKTS